MTRKCGACGWFDGEDLYDDGTGKGTCCLEPPVPIYTTALEVTWARPSVDVGANACRHFQYPYKERWWEGL